mmetsp:Transcript_20927/g.55829  ORF Transcript_20927/g.55829 Transcript_20927/m.55829 type:complete len:200 (+) Transcript_20927:249-848(+)
MKSFDTETCPCPLAQTNYETLKCNPRQHSRLTRPSPSTEVQTDRLRIPPLHVRLACHLFLDWCELPLSIHLHPILPDFVSSVGKHRVHRELCVPCREAREWCVRIDAAAVEDVGPLEHAGQHVLHEDSRGIPCEVCQRQLVAGQERASQGTLQPSQLLPDLPQFGSPCGCVHATNWPVPADGKIHGPLCVREPRGGAIR